MKPWNIVHDIEMTLSEILSKMPWVLENEAENLRNRRLREYDMCLWGNWIYDSY